MLPTKLIVAGLNPDAVEIHPDQIPERWHHRFEEDLTGQTLTYNGFALLVVDDEAAARERNLFCRIRTDLTGLDLPTVERLEPLAEEEF